MTFVRIALGLLRRSDGLFCLNVRRPEFGQSEPVAATTYEEELAAAEPSVVTAAFLRLAAVKEIEPWVREDVFTVLTHTVMDPVGDVPELPPLVIAPPPRPHRPTAANPRAYKGTKDRPPKPRRPAAMDLRPFLCSVSGQDRLLAALAAELGPVDAPSELREVPPLFRRYFEATLRGESERARNRALEAFHGLRLDRDAVLRRAVAAMFAASREHAAAWTAMLLALAPERRLPMLEILWKTAAVFMDASDRIEDLLAFDAHLSCDEFGEQMWYAVERCVIRGDSVVDLRCAQELLFDHAAQFPFERQDRVPSSADVAAVRAYAAATEDVLDYFPSHFLVAAGRLPGIGEALELIVAAEITAAAKVEAARPFAYLYEEDAPTYELQTSLRDLPEVLAHLGAVPPPYQLKGAEIFSEFVHETTTEELSFAAKLITRVCREPFRRDGYFYMLAEELAWLDDELQVEILAAEDTAFLVLEDRCRRKNDALLVAHGFAAFIDQLERFTVDGLLAAPSALCRVARILGAAARPVRDELLAEFAASELMQDRDFAAMTARGMLAWLTTNAGPAADSFVPRQLRRFVGGELELRPAQVERHQSKVRAALTAIRLAALEGRVVARLGEGLVGEEDLSDTMVHALLLQFGLRENRRALRRMLAAVFDGDVDSLSRHPGNVAWLAAHGKTMASVWSGGFERWFEHEGESIRLAVELDPLEALRLGTYAGSCLGLGGRFTDSAAAIVLDLNKQVVFARGQKGQFLARQVLAIDDRGRLCCFEVYPKVSAGLRRVFAKFDSEFASALGVEIASAGEEREPEIAMPVAQYWWHDGIWDLDETD